LEKGLRYAQKRQEELENIRFQISTLAHGDNKKQIDDLLVVYNNWMYPHLEMERKEFAEDSKTKFSKLKDAHKKFGDRKFSSVVDKDKKFNIKLGK